MQEIIGQAPIFIGGAPRSGTTLLRAIVNTSKGIVCGPESRIVPALCALSSQVEQMHMPLLERQYGARCRRACIENLPPALIGSSHRYRRRPVAESRRNGGECAAFQPVRRLFPDSR